MTTEIGKHQRLEARLDDGQPLDRRQHRDRRRDHRVAVEQRRRRARRARPAPPSSASPSRLREISASSAKDAALALVVGAHGDEHVFDASRSASATRRSGSARRRCAARSTASGCGPMKLSFKRVERRGADIAVDDADRAEHQGREASALRAGWIGCGRRRTGCAGVVMPPRCAAAAIKIPCGFARSAVREAARRGLRHLDERARRAHFAGMTQSDAHTCTLRAPAARAAMPGRC